jgi:hypothetical protein
MRPRQSLIVAVASVVAFAAAFAVSGAGGVEPQPQAAPLKPAEVIEVDAVTVSAGVTAAPRLPALNVPEPKKPDPPSTNPDLQPTNPDLQPTNPDLEPTNPDPQPTNPTPTPTKPEPLITGDG